MSGTAYDPKKVESKVSRRWERAKVFAPPGNPRRGRKAFSMVLPPPNVTGSLHMGHALNGTMQDALIRYHRMKGDDTVWISGTDHAGIATQNVVERELRNEGLTRHDLGREKFVERVWEWKKKYGGIITEQLRRLGASCDWSRERFTLDQGYTRAVQEAFIHYARKGLIYRGERMINWCPRCASAISDLEVEHKDEDAVLYTITYGPLKVATVRPETKFGDTGVAVNPKDERYRQYVGSNIEIDTVLGPATMRVVQDEAVDPNFGTGVVKVTPAHDFTDFEIGERHGLPPRQVIGENGRMNERAGPFRGLTVLEARAAVVEALRKKGLITKEEPYHHAIGVCSRCGTAVEPLISKQWFVRMEPLAQPAHEAAEKGLISFSPPRWKKVYLNWLQDVEDWCISRQLWWGHRIPAWYCQAGKTRGKEQKTENSHIVFSVAKPRKCPECGGTELVQDQDVLDTWFSSALWPFATFGWPAATADLRRFYPTSVLATAPDILSLWVVRMVFSSLEFMSGKNYLPAKHYGKRRREQQVPFRDVIVHPTVLTLAGKRMSKSKGVVVDPLDLIETYGADATRFGLLLQLREDQQALRFDEHAVRAARNFVNKVWNIGWFIQAVGSRQQAGGKRRRMTTTYSRLPTVFDHWILSRFSDTARRVTDMLTTYRFGEAARTLHDFVWDDVADWYIEVSKVPGMATPAVARDVFADSLRLLHPFLPFVTEELWEKFGDGELLARAAWPDVSVGAYKRGSVQGGKRASERPRSHAPTLIARFQQVVRDIRSARVLLGLPSSAKIRVRVSARGLAPLFPALGILAGCREVTAEDRKGAWMQLPVSGETSVQIHRDSLQGVDLRSRLAVAEERVSEARRQIEGAERRLTAMRRGAPPEIIAAAEMALAERKRALSSRESAVAVLKGMAE